MAKTTTASLILILLIVATLNDYSVEGAGKGNQKLGPVTDCYFLYLKCVVFRILFFCPAYSTFCLHHETTAATTTPKAENFP